MSTEIWKQMEEEGFENTFISNKGNVKRNNKILTPVALSVYDKSLCVTSLTLKNGKHRKIRIASMVCKYFKNATVKFSRDKITYKDGDHTNLCEENLLIEEKNYSKGSTVKKPVVLENIYSGEIKKFDCLNDACSFLKYKKGSMSSMISQAKKAGKKSMIFRGEWVVTDRIVTEEI